MNPACLVVFRAPSKIGPGVQPIALAAFSACSDMILQLMPAWPQEMIATLPVPGLYASVGSGNFTPSVCSAASTFAVAPEDDDPSPPDPSVLLGAGSSLLVVLDALLDEEEPPPPQPTTSAANASTIEQ